MSVQKQLLLSRPDRTSIDGASGGHAAHVWKRLPDLYFEALRKAGEAPGARHAFKRQAVQASGGGGEQPGQQAAAAGRQETDAQ